MAAITVPEALRVYLPTELDPGRLWITYNSQADSLTVYFTGHPVPSVWEDLDEYAYIGFAQDDERTVTGVMIEHFSQWLLAPQRRERSVEPA